MSLSINTNNAAMAALESLDATTNALNQTENEVSTGLKVGSAADNPAIYAITQSMNADIAGLSAVSDGLSFGAQVISTASTAVESINSTLATLKSTITNGQQNGVDPTTVNQQISSLLSDIDTFAGNATLNGVNLVAGSTGNGVDNTNLTVLTDTEATNSLVVGGTGTSALNASSAGLGLSGLTVATEGVQIQGLNPGGTATGISSSTTITLQNTNFVGGTTSSGAATSTNPGVQWTFSFSTAASSTTSSATSNVTDANGNTTQETMAVTIKATSGESSSDLMAALQSAMASVGFNTLENSDGSLDVTGNNIDSSSGMTVSSGPTGASAVALSGSQAAIDTVQAAITKLGTISSVLGSASDEVTGLETYTSGVGALSDADMSAESAQLTSLQTKQQLAIQSLSIANSQSSTILSLFRG